MIISKITRLIFLLIIFGMAGCSPETPEITSEFQEFDAKVNADEKFNFTTSLKGDNEVPANDSKAAGQAIVKISKDETYIEYKLIVANIDNVIMAHFHLAPAGINGGVVTWLFGVAAPPVDFNGVLAEGIITAEDVVGSIAGDFEALIEAIRAGNIYVNVHTTEYPGGEIRGQL